MEGEKTNLLGRTFLVLLTLVLVVAGAGGTYYFYSQHQKSQRELVEMKTGALDSEDVAAIVARVKELMELPENEEPTIATIRNTEGLVNHPFLSVGQVNDKLLIYTGKKLVVMYRPSVNKIVSVGTVRIEEAGAESEAESGKAAAEIEEEETVPEIEPEEVED